MESRPHPLASKWSSREDFTILCGKSDMKYTERFKLPTDDGGHVYRTVAEFHYECWHGEAVPEGHSACLPMRGIRNPHPREVWLRKTHTPRLGNMYRKLALILPVAVQVRRREIVPAEDGVEVSEEGDWIRVKQPGVFSLVIHRDHVLKWALDRTFAQQALKRIQDRINHLRKHRATNETLNRVKDEGRKRVNAAKRREDYRK